MKIKTLTAKDFKWDYERGRGKGGQKRNKTCSAVRCRHIESRAIGWAEDGRSQLANKRKAFERMANTKEFKQWIRIISAKKAISIEEMIDEEMKQENLKIETFNPQEDN